MTNFLSNFYKLCDKKGRSPSAVVDEIGLGRSTLSRWRSGAIPQAQTAQKVADYFGVSAEELNDADLLSSNKSEQAELLEELRRRPSMRTLFSLAKDATDEEINTAIKIIVALKK